MMYQSTFHEESLANKSFLVTGGAGFIGSNIVEYLLKYGAKHVRILDNFSTGFQYNIEPFSSNSAFECIEGDIRNLEDCRKAVDGMEYITHQAALGSVPRSINDPITTNEVNISGFLNMLVAAKDANVKNFVFAASSSTYGDHPGLPKIETNIGNPLSPYAVTKYVNELYAAVFSKTYNFNSIGLRYFNVFGPRQNPKGAYAAVIPLFIESALSGITPFINGDGETSRDFTFVENAVQANIKAMLNSHNEKFNVVNIACGEQTSLNQLWKVVCQLANIDSKPEYRDERIGDVKHSLADITMAKILLGYTPKVSVSEGLVTTFDYYSNVR